MIRKYLPAAVALAIFAWLAAMVTTGRTQQFDESIRMAVHGRASPALTVAMRNLSRIGEPAVLIVSGAVVFLILLAARRRRVALLVFVVVGGAEIFDQFLKLAFRRPRPPAFFGLQEPGGYSFPSGHALVSCTLFGALAVYAASRAGSRTLRWLYYVAAALPVLAIGLSRVYLGVHYPTDVLGGYAAAVFWLSVVYLLWRRSGGDGAFGSRRN